MTLYVESRIQSQAWALMAIGMTQGMTSEAAQQAAAAEPRFRMSAQGTPISELDDLGAERVLERVLQGEQEVGVLQHAGAVRLDARRGRDEQLIAAPARAPAGP